MNWTMKPSLIQLCVRTNDSKILRFPLKTKYGVQWCSGAAHFILNDYNCKRQKSCNRSIDVHSNKFLDINLIERIVWLINHVCTDMSIISSSVIKISEFPPSWMVMSYYRIQTYAIVAKQDNFEIRGFQRCKLSNATSRWNICTTGVSISPRMFHYGWSWRIYESSKLRTGFLYQGTPNFVPLWIRV